MTPLPSVVTAHHTATDPLAAFLADRTVDDPHASSTAHALYAAYLAWHHADGNDAPLTTRAFGAALRRHGYHKRKSGVIYWDGLRLVSDP